MSAELLIRWCAPTMARLKTGSIFTCKFDSRDQMTGDLRKLNQTLGQKGLRILPLKYQDGKALLYLYRPKLLERDLKAPAASRALRAGSARRRPPGPPAAPPRRSSKGPRSRCASTPAATAHAGNAFP